MKFVEVAELMLVWWLEIRGKINSRMLSKRSHYSSYLIFKLSDSANGLSHPLQNASVAIGEAQASNRPVHLMEQQYSSWHWPILRHRRRLRNLPNDPPVEPQDDLPEEMDEGGEDQLQRDRETVGRLRTRQDGWMEILLGEFYNEEGDDGEIIMSLMEVNCRFSKSGLIVQGIEIRPKK